MEKHPSIVSVGRAVSEVSFWMPRHYLPSPWTPHLPFAAWLTGVVRPERIVHVGAGLGMPVLGFAEVAQRLGLPARIIGVDPEAQNPDWGFDQIVRAASEDYPESVELHRAGLPDAIAAIGGARIDILSVSGDVAAIEDAVRAFRALLSEHAVVLLHGAGNAAIPEALAASTNASFLFTHAGGMRVISFEPAARLAELVDADGDIPDSLRAAYEELGRRVQHEVDLRGTLYGFRDEVIKLGRELALLRGSASWRLTAPVRRLRGRRH